MAGRLWWLPLVPLGLVSDRGSRRRWLSMPGSLTVTAIASSAAKLSSAAHVRTLRTGGLRGGVSTPPASPAPTPPALSRSPAGMRRSRHGRRLHLVAILIGCLRVRPPRPSPVDVVAGAILGLRRARPGWEVRAAVRRLVPRLSPAPEQQPRGSSADDAQAGRFPQLWIDWFGTDREPGPESRLVGRGRSARPPERRALDLDARRRQLRICRAHAHGAAAGVVRVAGASPRGCWSPNRRTSSSSRIASPRPTSCSTRPA